MIKIKLIIQKQYNLFISGIQDDLGRYDLKI